MLPWNIFRHVDHISTRRKPVFPPSTPLTGGASDLGLGRSRPGSQHNSPFSLLDTTTNFCRSLRSTKPGSLQTSFFHSASISTEVTYPARSHRLLRQKDSFDPAGLTLQGMRQLWFRLGTDDGRYYSRELRRHAWAGQAKPLIPDRHPAPGSRLRHEALLSCRNALGSWDHSVGQMHAPHAGRGKREAYLSSCRNFLPPDGHQIGGSPQKILRPGPRLTHLNLQHHGLLQDHHRYTGTNQQQFCWVYKHPTTNIGLAAPGLHRSLNGVTDST